MKLRAAGKTAPVLLYTGSGATESIIRGLDAGAQGYMVKPVSNAELKARVRSLVRMRLGTQTSDILRFGDISVQRFSRRVTRDGEPVNLTAIEVKLLEHLLMHANETVTRSDLLEKIWDMHFDPGSNVVDAHISRLRKKLRAAGSNVTIAGRRGFGFSIAVHDDTAT